MLDLTLRPATTDDQAFALHLTEVCMRAYAEQTWGSWNGQADLDIGIDQIIQRSGVEIGMIGVERRPDHWFMHKLYLLPENQNQGIGSTMIERLQSEARTASAEVRLTVLEVNPARRFYERHGFTLAETIPPRRHMRWSAR